MEVNTCHGYLIVSTAVMHPALIPMTQAVWVSQLFIRSCSCTAAKCSSAAPAQAPNLRFVFIWRASSKSARLLSRSPEASKGKQTPHVSNSASDHALQNNDLLCVTSKQSVAMGRILGRMLSIHAKWYSVYISPQRLILSSRISTSLSALILGALRLGGFRMKSAPIPIDQSAGSY